MNCRSAPPASCRDGSSVSLAWRRVPAIVSELLAHRANALIRPAPTTWRAKARLPDRAAVQERVGGVGIVAHVVPDRLIAGRVVARARKRQLLARHEGILRCSHRAHRALSKGRQSLQAQLKGRVCGAAPLQDHWLAWSAFRTAPPGNLLRRTRARSACTPQWQDGTHRIRPDRAGRSRDPRGDG